MNLKLNRRNEEIASLIPKSVRSIVLNAILAKAVDEGMLEKELSYHIPSNELADIISTIFPKKRKIKKEICSENELSQDKPKKKRGRPKGSTKTETICDPLEDVFCGFDD